MLIDYTMIHLATLHAMHLQWLEAEFTEWIKIIPTDAEATVTPCWT